MRKRHVLHIKVEIFEDQLAALRLHFYTYQIPCKFRCDHCGDYGHLTWECRLKKQAERELENEKQRRIAVYRGVSPEQAETYTLCPTCQFEWPDRIVRLGGVTCCGKSVLSTRQQQE